MNLWVVANPSYPNARILEILPESLNDFISHDQTLLCESDDFKNFIEEEKIQVFENTAVNQFLSGVIYEQFCEVISKKIRFNL